MTAAVGLAIVGSGPRGGTDFSRSHCRGRESGGVRGSGGRRRRRQRRYDLVGGGGGVGGRRSQKYMGLGM